MMACQLGTEVAQGKGQPGARVPWKALGKDVVQHLGARLRAGHGQTPAGKPKTLLFPI